MSKSLKAKLPFFAVLSAIVILLASLLYGQGQATKASQQESSSTKVQSSQPFQASQEKVTEMSGTVKTVNLKTRVIVIELSRKDSDLLGGMTEAKIQIDANTKIKNVDNTKGDINSIMAGAPLEVKIASGIDMASAPKIEAAKVELLIACTKSQGCEDSGACARACSSDVCACPKPKSNSSPSTP